MSPAPSAAVPAGKSSSDQTNEDVYERIYGSILEHRLAPGTKLPEERLAGIFGISRPRIREILARLAYEQIVEVIPNKGAYIARPSIQQAREVFEARRVIEPAIMRKLATCDDHSIARLGRLVDDEIRARKEDDKRRVIRLSGEFHNLAADLASNAALARSLRELTSLTCLIILLYDAPTALTCRPDDHQAIVRALKKGDGDDAARLITAHLDTIEDSVDLKRNTDDVDLEEIFS